MYVLCMGLYKRENKWGIDFGQASGPFQGFDFSEGRRVKESRDSGEKRKRLRVWREEDEEKNRIELELSWHFGWGMPTRHQKINK